MFKKSLFTALLATLVAVSANAQGFYLRLGPGYTGKGAGIGLFGSESSYDRATNGSTKLISSKPLSFSLGRGFNFNVTPGYMFNEFIGAELDINLLFGSKTLTDKSTTTGSGYSRTNVSESRLQGGAFLSPSIIITTGGEGKLKPYARFGVVVNLAGKVVSDENYELKNGSNTETTVSTQETKLSAGLGLVGGLGINYAMSDKISLYAEVTANSISAYNKSSEYTAYEEKENGTVTGKLSDWKTYNKQTNYVKELTSASNGQEKTDLDKAADDLRSKLNLSSFGLRIGVKIAFGSK